MAKQFSPPAVERYLTSLMDCVRRLGKVGKRMEPLSLQPEGERSGIMRQKSELNCDRKTSHRLAVVMLTGTRCQQWIRQQITCCWYSIPESRQQREGRARGSDHASRQHHRPFPPILHLRSPAGEEGEKDVCCLFSRQPACRHTQLSLTLSLSSRQLTDIAV